MGGGGAGEFVELGEENTKRWQGYAPCHRFVFLFFRIDWR